MHQNTILKLLCAQEDGTYLSGEELSRALHITRAAVWKEIQALRGEGYEIESKTRRGYRLRAAPEAVTPEALAARIDVKTVGRHILCFDALDSTNTYAKKPPRKEQRTASSSSPRNRPAAGAAWAAPSTPRKRGFISRPCSGRTCRARR